MNSEDIKNNNHNINIAERSFISLTGINKICNFDSDEFIIDTICGKLGVKGQNLEIVKLDTYSKTISIKGTIDALTYLTKEKVSKDGIITKLFK